MNSICIISLYKIIDYFLGWNSCSSYWRNIHFCKDCTADVLHAAVNFMYGISIPDNFKEGSGLLRLADLLMMEGLKQEAAKLLAKNLTTENYLEASQAAELYSVENLINSCAEFVFEKVKDVDWEEMEKLPKVMSAFVKIAKKEKEKREGAGECCEGLLNEARLFSEMLKMEMIREELRERARRRGGRGGRW